MTTTPNFGEVFTEKFYSPVALIRKVNETLELSLPTQMAYNYIKKGYITASLNSTGKKQVAQAECVRWATAYFEKNHKPEEAEVEVPAEA
jgi:hypothetical protein